MIHIIFRAVLSGNVMMSNQGVRRETVLFAEIGRKPDQGSVGLIIELSVPVRMAVLYGDRVIIPGVIAVSHLIRRNNAEDLPFRSYDIVGAYLDLFIGLQVFEIFPVSLRGSGI